MYVECDHQLFNATCNHLSDSGQSVLLLVKSPAGIPHLEHKYYEWLYMNIQKIHRSKITDNQHYYVSKGPHTK